MIKSYINLWAVVIAAFFLISCKKDADLGQNIYPNNDMSALTMIDTVSLVTSTIYHDSIPTSNATTLLCGKYTDPYFGTITTNAYSQVRLLNVDGISFGTGAVLDSVVLKMTVSYGYGDTTIPQTINVHRITSDLKSDSIYRSSRNFPYDATALGSKTIIINKVAGKTFNIRLNDSFGNELMQMPISTTKSQENFVSQVKGLALVAGNEIGSVIGFPLLENACAVIVYFRNDNATNLSATYPLNTSSVRFNHISSNKSGTAISSLLTNYSSISTKNTSDLGYLQSGTGIRFKVEIPHIRNLNNMFDGRFVLNKAEIEFPVVADGANKYSPPVILRAYETNANNKIILNSASQQMVLQEDGVGVNTTSEPQDMYYNSTTQKYILSCTKYVEALMIGAKQNNGFILIPTSNQVTVNRALLYGAGNSTSKPVLKIYYSVIK